MFLKRIGMVFKKSLKFSKIDGLGFKKDIMVSKIVGMNSIKVGRDFKMSCSRFAKS
jgi:hypothetical protein